MRNSELSKLMSVAGRILLAFLFVFSQSAWAGQDQKTTDKAESAQKAISQQEQVKQTPAASAKAQSQEARNTAEARDVAEESAAAEEKSSRNGSNQGIKVHGHWTIDVRDPDGKPVSHREFENSLMPSGKDILSNCLANGCALPSWQFVLIKNNNSPFFVPATASSAPGKPITLTGSAPADSSSTFVAARTVVIGIADFTGTGISPVAVTTGQIVQVTVVISFS